MTYNWYKFFFKELSMIILYKATLDFYIIKFFMWFYNIMKYYLFIYFNGKNYLKNPSKSCLRHSISREKKYLWIQIFYRNNIILEKVFHLLILSGQISTSSLFGNASLLFRAQITSISQTTPCHNFGS